MEKKEISNVIQISTCGVEQHSGTQCDWITTVLCSDGTIWEKKNGRDVWICIN